MGTVKVEGHFQTQWIKKNVSSRFFIYLSFRFDSISKVFVITSMQKSYSSAGFAPQVSPM